MKILIVEDEVNSREGLADLLLKISSEYIVCGKASDGEQGVSLARELEPDLIIADIEMPKLNGLEMIEKIKETGANPLFIILSGYSDFKYAQRGIKLGIAEYLLKPITYSALKNMMEEVSDKLSIKKAALSKIQSGIPDEEILKEILIGKGKSSEDAYKTIEARIKKDENMFLINCYLKEQYRDKDNIILSKFNGFANYYGIKTCFCSNIKECNYITALIGIGASYDDIIKMLKYNFMFSLGECGFKEVPVSLIKLDNLSHINNSLNELKVLSRWSVVLGSKEIISDALIKKLKAEKCIYPRDIEAEAQQAMNNNDYKKLMDANGKLVLFFKDKIYDPASVLEVYSQYVFSIISHLAVITGGYNISYGEFKYEDVVELIKNSCTLEELEEILNRLTEKLFRQGDDKSIMYSLPIRKTMNYIKEYYVGKLSLEEIAAKMNLTPEYLSRLFTKEVGKSFSDYIKEYRIDKARKLLLNEKVKIYEVAEKVGYNDPKYFCKIFKEITGMSPKEYMKVY